jgi:hypothetical protein
MTRLAPNRNYRDVNTDDVPVGRLVFHVPAESRGQMIEVAYADPRPMAAPADVGSLWRRITDETGAVEYQRRVGPAWVEVR